MSDMEDVLYCGWIENRSFRRLYQRKLLQFSNRTQYQYIAIASGPKGGCPLGAIRDLPPVMDQQRAKTLQCTVFCCLICRLRRWRYC